MNSAVILAAGSGKRTGLSYNKVFAKIKGEPILYHTIKAFEENDEVDEIVLVLKEEEKKYFLKEFSKYNFKKIKSIAIGGVERQDSVRAGLEYVSEETDIVLIHDGARCFVTKDIICDGIKYAKIHGAETPGVIPKDTIKIVNNDGLVVSDTNRKDLRAVQTPQCFNYKTIKNAYYVIKSNELYTDDNEVYRKYLKNNNKLCKIYVYDSDYSNIKITTFDDIKLAESY